MKRPSIQNTNPVNSQNCTDCDNTRRKFETLKELWLNNL